MHLSDVYALTKAINSRWDELTSLSVPARGESIAKLITDHCCHADSQTHRLIVVNGIGYQVPNKVADAFQQLKNDNRTLSRELHDRIRETKA